LANPYPFTRLTPQVSCTPISGSADFDIRFPGGRLSFALIADRWGGVAFEEA
jgi:hypothetical protein